LYCAANENVKRFYKIAKIENGRLKVMLSMLFRLRFASELEPEPCEKNVGFVLYCWANAMAGVRVWGLSARSPKR
jgi:hypothetical protein